MKKIILFGALIITAIICYVLGYVLFSFDNPSINLKDKDYVLPINSTSEESNDYDEKYYLYPAHGELIIFRADGSFYDNTGIFLSDLTREEQIELLQNKESFNITELYGYLNELSLQTNNR